MGDTIRTGITSLDELADLDPDRLMEMYRGARTPRLEDLRRGQKVGSRDGVVVVQPGQPRRPLEVPALEDRDCPRQPPGVLG